MTETLQEQEKPKLEIPEDLKRDLMEIVMIMRAAQGLPIDSDSIITQLTDVKNIMERSRFPTYPLLGKQVYLRLMATYIPEAKAAFDWAENEAHALIGYKGQARTESVEMNKAATMQPAQQFLIGEHKQQQIEQPKRHFWSRGQPKEHDEFEGQ